MGGRTTPPRSPYKPSQVPHSAQGLEKGQKAVFPLGEEVRISRLELGAMEQQEQEQVQREVRERLDHVRWEEEQEQRWWRRAVSMHVDATAAGSSGRWATICTGTTTMGVE